MTGRLYLVPNLLGAVAPEQVLPAHTIAIARGLTQWVVETPKPARAFIKTLGPPRPIADLTLRELAPEADAAALAELLAPAKRGEDIGLLSDAGCPGVADPGALLVAAAHAANVRVVPLVGPSAILLALMVSGMNGQSFAFHGYLPVKPEPRVHKLRELDDDIARSGRTQLFIETPYRNQAMIAAVIASCHPSTCFAVAADLTTADEWIRSAPLAAWKNTALPALDKRPALFALGRMANRG